MKLFGIIPLVKSSFMSIIGVLIIFAISSCATRKVSFLDSSVVPAAKGYVKIKKDDNNNYSIKIEIANLAEPDKLQPSKNFYVVWMETDNDGIKNIGQIKTSTGFLSQKLSASFETVSSFKPVRIYITAEDDASVQYLMGQRIMSTNKF